MNAHKFFLDKRFPNDICSVCLLRCKKLLEEFLHEKDRKSRKDKQLSESRKSFETSLVVPEKSVPTTFSPRGEDGERLPPKSSAAALDVIICDNDTFSKYSSAQSAE
jgi:hypothetical protein